VIDPEEGAVGAFLNNFRTESSTGPLSGAPPPA
jgi:hypothetical protein